MNNDVTSKLLMASIATLESSVVPNLKSDQSGIALDLVIRTLRMLHADYSRGEVDMACLIESTESLLEESSRVIDDGEESQLDVEGSDTLRIRYEVLNNEIARQIPTLVDKASTGEDPSAINVLATLIKTQEDFLASQDPDIRLGSAVVFRGGRIDRSGDQPVDVEKPSVTEEGLTEYLRNKFTDSPNIYADQVKVISGGFSKTTVLFDMVETSGKITKVVMRKDLPILFLGKTVENEFPLLTRVSDAGINVAKPLWLETDNALFGGSFFVSDLVSGTSDMNEWVKVPEAMHKVGEQLAILMADLHNLDLASLGYSEEVAGKSAGDAMADEIAYWENLYETKRSQRHPLLEIVLAWLKLNIPEELFDRPARIVHGDIGFHNLMVDNGKVTSLLDWEFAHFGDPAEDILYVRPFIEKIVNWDVFFNAYRNAGGPSFSDATGIFFNVWSFARNALGTIDAGYLYKNHLPEELKLAVAGLIFGSYLELDASKLILGILEGNTKAVSESQKN